MKAGDASKKLADALKNAHPDKASVRIDRHRMSDPHDWVEEMGFPIVMRRLEDCAACGCGECVDGGSDLESRDFVVDSGCTVEYIFSLSVVRFEVECRSRSVDL